MRDILDAIFYLVRTGCQWRNLPHEYPPWSTVHCWFRRWRRDGTWERLHGALREQLRVAGGRDPQPSAGVIDSQSVKTTGVGGVLPWRWVVERTFSWTGQSRRLSKDYEHLCATGEVLVSLAMTRIMLRRLAHA